MKAFAVIKNTQASDGDDWNHWVDEQILSYHFLKEKAEDRIKELLKIKYDAHMKNHEHNTHWSKESWQLLGEEILNNIAHFEIGTEHESVQKPILVVLPIHIEE